MSRPEVTILGDIAAENSGDGALRYPRAFPMAEERDEREEREGQAKIAGKLIKWRAIIRHSVRYRAEIKELSSTDASVPAAESSGTADEPRGS